jgi:hypothetical protein
MKIRILNVFVDIYLKTFKRSVALSHFFGLAAAWPPFLWIAMVTSSGPISACYFLLISDLQINFHRSKITIAKQSSLLKLSQSSPIAFPS